MRAHWSIRVAPLLLFVLTRTALGGHVVVPDDYASIQAAMDSGTDTVLVKDGTYDENLVMHQSVNVLAFVTWFSGYPHFAAPVVGAFTVNQPCCSHLSGIIQGLRMRGPVSLTFDEDALWFESCRFDSGVVTNSSTGSNRLYFRGCTFLRQCTIHVAAWELTNCVLVGTGLDGAYEGYALIRNNVVVGPAAIGISLPDQDGGGDISGNQVSGTTDGIVVYDGVSTTVADNEVRNCSGTAYRSAILSEYQRGGSVYFDRNRAVACGGRGFDVAGGQSFSLRATANCVDSTGSDGIYVGADVLAVLRDNVLTHVGGSGIGRAEHSYVLVAARNRVIGTGADGISVGPLGRADSNIVGRVNGRGIVVSGFDTLSTLRANTVYDCGGSGIVAEEPIYSIDQNIASGNGGYGLLWNAGGSPALDCNDWFGNISGATSGVPPGVTDLDVNPLYCDLPGDDVHLSALSPLANAPGCGLIGAQDIGCTEAVSVRQADEPGEVTLSARPSPTRGHVTFTLRGAQGPVLVEIFDLTGARRWRAAWPVGQQDFEWAGSDAGNLPVASGVYYARLTAGKIMRTARVVVVR